MMTLIQAPQYKIVECPSCKDSIRVDLPPPRYTVTPPAKSTPLFQYGFDKAIELVVNTLNSYDAQALFTVHKFISEFRIKLKEEVEVFKKDE